MRHGARAGSDDRVAAWQSPFVLLDVLPPPNRSRRWRLVRLLRWIWGLLFRPKAAVPTTPEQAKRIARLFYLTRLMQRAQGRRVRFMQRVDRSPHFEVKRGAEGVLVGLSFDPRDGRAVIRVALDDAIAGALVEFNGEVHWKEGVNLEDFEKDVVLLGC